MSVCVCTTTVRVRPVSSAPLRRTSMPAVLVVLPSTATGSTVCSVTCGGASSLVMVWVAGLPAEDTDQPTGSAVALSESVTTTVSSDSWAVSPNTRTRQVWLSVFAAKVTVPLPTQPASPPEPNAVWTVLPSKWMTR